MKKSTVGAAAIFAVAGSAFGAVVDGVRDATYGSPLVVQNTASSFGDANVLAAAYCQPVAGGLNMFFSGRLGTGFEKLMLFFDTRSGGTNPLNGTPGQGSLGSMSGLHFDTGFNPDFSLQINGDGTNLYVDYAELGNPTGGAFAGQGGYGTGGALAGGTGAAGLLVTTLNGALAPYGFGFGPLTPADQIAAAAYATGTELFIPSSLIGSPSGSFRMSAFIAGGDGSTRSNQFLGGVNAGIAVNDYGPLSGLDLDTIPGAQNFSVPAPGAVGLLGLGGLLVGRRRR